MIRISLLSAFKDALRCFAPPLCFGCDRALVSEQQLVCTACQKDLPTTEFHTIHDNPFVDKFFGRILIEAGAAYLYFTKRGVAQNLVHHLKYKGRSRLGRYVGIRYGYILKEAKLFQSIDLIIPVPLHRKRKNTRGYNQSDFFAGGLSESMNIPVNYNAVIRSRATSTQTKKTRIERFANVDGAFKVIDPSAITHKHILLVDDVLTTGATLEGCAQELLRIDGVKLSMATIGFAYFQ